MAQKLPDITRPALPTPLGSWVLVRKEKKGGGIIRLDTAADAFDFVVIALGPDVAGDLVGHRVELQPKLALASGVMLDDKHALLQASGIVGVYE